MGDEGERGEMGNGRAELSERMMLRLRAASWEGAAQGKQGGKGKPSKDTVRAETLDKNEKQGMKKTSVSGRERKRAKSERHFKGRSKKNCRYLEFRPLRS